jgi:hypothetical protein
MNMMKKLLILAICIIAPCIKALADEYTVSKVYEVEELPYGSKAIDTYGSVVEIDKLFVPVKLEEGKYKVTVSRKGDNLYRIDGTDYYIETSLCYEYGVYMDAILEVYTTPGVPYSFGNIYFTD